jgi:thioredoxin reductase (NADPH)
VLFRSIVVDAEMKTNLPGVFAAGDVVRKKYRQITTAMGDGTIAALTAANFISSCNSKV